MHELSFHFEEIVTIDYCQQNYSGEHVIYSIWKNQEFSLYAVAEVEELLGNSLIYQINSIDSQG